MSLKQINMGYDARQDRIVLRLSTSDDKLAQLYFTRRMVKGWSRGLEQRLVQIAALESVDELKRGTRLAFEHEVASQECEFDRDFKPGKEVVTGEEPSVVVEVSIMKANSPDATKMGFRLLQGGVIGIILDKADMHGFVRVLNNAIAASGWDLPPVVAQALTTASQPSALH